MDYVLRTNALSKKYKDYKALNGLSMNVPKGAIYGFVGKNGAGKSTLLKTINDLIVPTSGQVLVNGQPIGATSKYNISYLPERTYLDKTMRVKDALKFFTEVPGRYSLSFLAYFVSLV